MSDEQSEMNGRVIELEEQVVELQTRVLFQEDSLQSLDDVIAKQQRQLDDLTRYCQLLKASMEGMRGDSADGGEVAVDLPPHY
ncbi:SlyX protein [Sinobacterium caligoides]|uniref:SlyX protein n=1 Tax=Sinobacterium caligoides TaxID=933926 RepID=A0A3N2DZK2_9GAMM|nr:SlyX family protein [Sinobacterium caligoides]ROS05258.1 SlyX protein [Sinobacterium caligoides]